ncbi:CLIP domain-containing serine protease HP8-like isoform X2 [Galleria mellonella]|uniref:CLIP domain-containing serine protease HP8-like isoform X2 n=1 Tax=Galleria mellonella TaxID=7137 RepID=A0A6J3CG16_GALME|nr:CLIP domain-containing serine protease HP8-like isoform X2 [Galleria mellonella]
MIQWKYCFILIIVTQNDADDQTTSLDNRLLEVSHHPTWDKLDAFDCGDSAADRIIGGVNAALGQFPWIARLGYTHEDDLDWLCGGVLVSDQHVITAAHCLLSADDGYELSSVRLGEHNTETNPDCQINVCAPPVQDRKVKSIKNHPLFNKPAFHNDIAIIELESPVELNDYVAPICLLRSREQVADLQIGELVTVAGWGKMNMTTDQRANILQVVILPIVSPDMCSNFGAQFKVSHSEICAGAQHNKDACGGDSGGPLMKVYDTPDGPKHFLVGVVSFGPSVCGIKKPGVYSSVAFFLKWILDNLY